MSWEIASGVFVVLSIVLAFVGYRINVYHSRKKKAKDKKNEKQDGKKQGKKGMQVPSRYVTRIKNCLSLGLSVVLALCGFPINFYYSRKKKAGNEKDKGQDGEKEGEKGIWVSPRYIVNFKTSDVQE